MPTFTATPIAGTTHTRLELDWSDNTAVQYVRVIRLRAGEAYSTTTHTGGAAIRLPAWGDTFTDEFGEWTYLSNGRAVFYDTEAPLDEPVTWTAVAVTRTSTVLATDTYTRTVANAWGVADSGQTWILAGTAADFDVGSGVGTIVATGAWGISHTASLTLLAANNRRLQIDFSWSQTNLGIGHMGVMLIGRYVDDSNFWFAEMVATTVNKVRVMIGRMVAGVRQDVLSVPLNYRLTGGQTWRFILDVEVASKTLRAKVWPLATAEPADWQGEVVDLTMSSGTAVAVRATTYAPGTSFVLTTDNFRVDQIDAGTATVSTTPATTISSDGKLWLKDPLRPALDRPLDLCPTDASGCVLPAGMFFHSLDSLSRAADHQIHQIANRVRPTSTSQVRKAPTSVLRIVTRTLDDRDALVALTAAGTPLLLQAPAVYGLPDFYLQVADVSETRLHSDHRVPLRLFTLPWAEQDAPAGPAEGLAETRWDDLCTTYATWTALVAAGHTWTDIMQGDAA